MNREIGVGLVGYGLAGKVFHGMLVDKTPGLAVRAVMTRNEARQRQAREDFPDAAIYDSYEAMLNDEHVDLVVIGTPHETHKDLTIQAASKGKHVVVDKIMAPTSAEADAMIEACRRHGVLLSVFQNRRWDSDYLTVKNAIEQGWLGQVYSVESSVVRFAEAPDSTKPLPWRMHSKHAGGPFRDWGAHLMDQAVQLFGLEIEGVYADFQYRWEGIDVETAAVCHMRFSNGVRYRVEVGSISMIGRPRWYVRGSKGALTIEGLDPQEPAQKEGEVICGTEKAKMPREACRLESIVEGAELQIIPGDYLEYYRNVERAIRTGEKLAVDPENVRDVLRVIEAAVESAERDEVVRL